MRDYLLGIEHKQIQIEYDSLRDLKFIKEEVQSLKIRKELLTQVKDALSMLELPSIQVLR